MAGGVLQWPSWACGHGSDGPEGKEKHLPALWFAETSGLVWGFPHQDQIVKPTASSAVRCYTAARCFGPDAPDWAQVPIAYVAYVCSSPFKSNRTLVNYDPMDEIQIAEINSQVRRYLEGTLDEIDVRSPAVGSPGSTLLDFSC